MTAKIINGSRFALALIWMLIVAVLALMAVTQNPDFDSSIMNLLPKSEQQPKVQLAINQVSERFSKRMILLFTSDDDNKAQLAVATMAEVLTELPDIANIKWQVNDEDMVQAQRELYPYRFSILDPSIRKHLLRNEFKPVQDRALLNLYSPLNTGRSSIIDDPFRLYSELNLNRKNNFNIQISNSLFKVIGVPTPTYMLTLTLAGESYSPSLQKRVLSVINLEKDKLNEKGVILTMSGLLLHTAAEAKQANHEIATVGLGSLLGIIIMILLVFRQFKPLVLMIVAVTIGCLTALSVTTLIFEQVHLITLVFGIGLVGVSIDYALHFLCERRNCSAKTIVNKILPGLTLGLFSSVMAYAAQALAPFPGLQQMAVFSVIGLCASWLTVILCFPLWTHNDSEKSLVAARILDRFRQSFPRIEDRPMMIGGILCACLLLALSTLSSGDYADDVRLLQSPAESLIGEEKKVQKYLNASGSSQFLVIQADDIEHCLQKEEQIRPVLEQLISDNLMGGYQSITSFLPSLQRQAENNHLVEQLYEQQLTPFYESIDLSVSDIVNAQKIMKQTMKQALTPEVWLSQENSSAWRDLIVRQVDRGAATTIHFTGKIDEAAVIILKQLSTKDKGIVFVDRIQNISDLIGGYRSEAVKLIALAYLGVIIVLFIRYKLQVWRIIFPPILASIFTLSTIVYLGYGINIFHLMALILVLGIGLDMGIFLIEIHKGAHTWLAASLSTYTSVLAFGLLVLSDTPVLHHFGLTVFLGLSFIWLLTPIMRGNNSRKAILQ